MVRNISGERIQAKIILYIFLAIQKKSLHNIVEYKCFYRSQSMNSLSESQFGICQQRNSSNFGKVKEPISKLITDTKAKTYGLFQSSCL